MSEEKKIKSIIQKDKECFICRKYFKIEGSPDDVHHCIHGSMRERADKDGLTVYLCRFHHERLHDKGEFDRALQVEAQRCFISNEIRKGFTEEDARNTWYSHYQKFWE